MTKKDVQTPSDPDVGITYRGITVTVPRDADEWPTKAELARLKAASSGEFSDWLVFLEAVLGPEQWTKVTKTLKRGEFYEFVREFNSVANKECSV